MKIIAGTYLEEPKKGCAYIMVGSTFIYYANPTAISILGNAIPIVIRTRTEGKFPLDLQYYRLKTDDAILRRRIKKIGSEISERFFTKSNELTLEEMHELIPQLFIAAFNNEIDQMLTRKDK